MLRRVDTRADHHLLSLDCFCFLFFLTSSFFLVLFFFMVPRVAGVEKLAAHARENASVAVAVDAGDSQKRPSISHNVRPIPTLKAA